MNDAEEKKRAETAKIVKSIVENTDWKVLDDLAHHRAREIRIRYDALIRRNFTETQALDLCWRAW